MTHSITLTNPQQAHQIVNQSWAWIKGRLLQGKKVTLTLEDERRSSQQNRMMWDILWAFAQQKLWIVNGRECRMDADDWKDTLTAAFQRETRMAQGLDGGVVMLGARTSKWDKARMGEFLDFLQAAAVEHGVEWE